MAITSLNACMGAATLYTGAFGATEPAYTALTTPPSSSLWTDVGGTADGTPITFEVDQTYTDISVDQLVDPIGARLTKRMIQVTATLEEATLNNLNTALNNLATISPQSGYSVLDPLTASSAGQPDYSALIIDGWAPTAGTSENACRRRIIVRRCLASAKVNMAYEKSKPVLYACTWTAYFVSSSIAPYEIVDQTT